MCTLHDEELVLQCKESRGSWAEVENSDNRGRHVRGRHVKGGNRDHGEKACVILVYIDMLKTPSCRSTRNKKY